MPNHQEGTYQAWLVAPDNSAVSRAASLTVLIPPQILTQPEPVTARLGQTATFFVVTDELPSSGFQWRKNGIPIAKANSASFTLASVRREDDALYDVVVANAMASAVSVPVRLTVLIPPTVVDMVTHYEVVQGQDAVLSVRMDGSVPMSFRWRKSNITLRYELNRVPYSFLTLRNIQPADGGPNLAYTVVVTNQASSPPGLLSPGIVLHVLADTDQDGLPDEYEAGHGLEDPDADADGDGMGNGQEYIAGTDPNDGNSYLRVGGIEAGEDVLLEFRAEAKKTYTIEFKDDLLELQWRKLSDVPASLEARTVRLTDPTAAAARMYRLVTPRQD